MDKLEDIGIFYKDHREFFERFFKLRSDFFENWSMSYLDPEHIPIAFQKFISLINWSSSQTKDYEILSLENRQKVRNRIKTLISQKKPSEALDVMEEYMDKVSVCQEEVQILPKVQKPEEEDQIEKFWREEKHKGLKNIKKGFIDVLKIQK